MYKRAGMLAALLRSLSIQIEECKAEDKVEVLTNVDHGESAGGLTTGQKRNDLVTQAKGKYIVHVDDDDAVPPYYIEELLKAAESDADCFSISGIITTDGKEEKVWHISKDNNYAAKFDAQGKEYYERYPNHITPMKRSIASMIKFPHQSIGEDYIFATILHKEGLLKTEYRIDRFPMYYYKFVRFK
jgi:hypothetical protein